MNESLRQVKGSVWRKVAGFTGTILLACIAAVIIAFLILAKTSTCHVSGRSMYPLLEDGDEVLYLAPVAGVKIGRGDVVAIKLEKTGENICKRIIGVEGDIIEFDPAAAAVYRNGQLLDEPYLGSPTTNSGSKTGPIVVEKGHVFVMGDNRQHSIDSRYEAIGEDGQIPADWIIGKLVLVLRNQSEGAGIRPPWMWKIISSEAG